MSKKNLNRREFAKLAGSAALLASATTLEAPAERSSAAQQQEGAAPALQLTPEQEERVQQARERTLRQMRGLRPEPIPYEAEPAFVFRAKAAEKEKS